jgi:hypothetical protein
MCIVSDCKTNRLQTKYCDLHVNSSTLCNNTNCINIKMVNSRFCFIHV